MSHKSSTFSAHLVFAAATAHGKSRTRTCNQDRARGSTSRSGSQGCIVFPAGSGGDVTLRTEGSPVWFRLVNLMVTFDPATDAPDQGSGPVLGDRIRLQHMCGSRGWAVQRWDRG